MEMNFGRKENFAYKRKHFRNLNVVSFSREDFLGIAYFFTFQLYLNYS